MAQAVKLTCISLQTGKEMPIPAKTILCLGNFDGVHRGHQALIRESLRIKKTLGENVFCGAFCFWEHSSDLLLKNPPEHLTTADERTALFAAYGLEFVIYADFSELRALSPEVFAKEILRGACRCVSAVCGFNYRFGKGASGAAEDLCRLLGAPVTVCPAVMVDGAPVSSTRIRAAVREGKVDEAARLLGRPYTLEGIVKHGKELGRKLGFPTANQDFPPVAAIPRHGVYATDCILEGAHYRGVSNVGNHPTVDSPESAINCETYLIGYEGDLYGKSLKVEFLQFLRPEKTFESVETLKKQIAFDAEQANRILDQ